MHNVYMQAVDKCKAWHKERRWLIRNRLDPNNYPEEKKFQKIIKEIGLLEGAKAQKMQAAIQYSIKKRTFVRIEEKRHDMLHSYQKLMDMLTKAEYNGVHNQG